MRKITLVFTMFACALMVNVASADHIWINEFHYDNPGADVGEFVEVGIRTPNGSGAVASDYAVEFYNGSNGTAYNLTTTLDTWDVINAFAVAGSTDTITLYALSIAGIQNGAPDGLAVVNLTNSTLVGGSFLSYEGTFTATSGIANGTMSMDIGVVEGASADTSVGASGMGFGADQFGATSYALSSTQTFGGINTGQTFTRNIIPEPGSMAILSLIAIAGLGVRRRT